jgi:hypothetical protein
LEGINLEISFSDFLARAEASHGGRYDYVSGFFPAHLTARIPVTCQAHGVFYQQIRRHLGGAGCSACARQRNADLKKTGRQSFVEKAQAVHKGKFSYPEWASAPGAHDKVPVVCPVHGEFQQAVASHLGGAGCRKCENASRRGSGGLTFTEFMEAAGKKHGQFYTYLDWVGRRQVKDLVHITCPLHGGFEQRIQLHLLGRGCTRCGYSKSADKKALTFEEFKARATKIHGEKYIYTPWLGKKQSKDRYTALCPAHGEFSAILSSHFTGRGCRVCGSKAAAIKRNLGWEGFLRRARDRHDNLYTYPPQEYSSNAQKIKIVCLLHGEFEQTAAEHLAGHKCPACVEQAKRERVLTFDDFLAAVGAGVEGKYSWKMPETYWGMSTLLDLTCPEHGEFQQSGAALLKSAIPCPECRHTDMRRTYTGIAAQMHALHPNRDWEFVERGEDDLLVFHCDGVDSAGKTHGVFKTGLSNFNRGVGCPKCARKRSKSEFEVRDFISSLGLDTATGSNNTLPGLGKYQLDIVIPEERMAIEYNGLVWHSERFKREAKNAHINKTKLAESLGYRLIHIFEDEWLEKRELVENRLKAILGVGVVKLHARKTEARTIPARVASTFLTAHHMQGKGPPSKYNYGLFYQGALVAVATFAKARYSKADDWELVRFAASARVVGGMSKLLAAFKREAKPTGTLISYADRRWSDGGLYKALGFEFAGNTEPNYFYVKGQKRFSREKFQKHKLEGKLKKFDKSLSEVINCSNNGFYRIFDCGSSRWRLQL